MEANISFQSLVYSFQCRPTFRHSLLKTDDGLLITGIGDVRLVKNQSLPIGL